jgi:Kef-type K+ transport system membrane component KefB
MDHQVFFQLGLAVAVALLFSGLMRLLKQPLIIGYILAGILLGFFQFLSVNEAFSTFSEIGISILLFMVGLSLNTKHLQEIGKVSALIAFGQVILTSILSFGLMWTFRVDWVTSIYIALAISFSSTIVVTKLFSDKNILETLYGRIAVGSVIVQDLIAVFVLMGISSLGGHGNFLTWETLLKISGSITLLYLISRFFLPWFTAKIAKSQELLLLFALAWCLSIASLFGYMGLSIEIGALFAGLSLSASTYRFEISSKIKPLRDFFIMIFFLILGSQLVFIDLLNQIPLIISISIFAIIGKAVFNLIFLGLLGYSKKTAFLVSLSSTQISEFSLKLVILGIAAGHLTYSSLSLITFASLITIIISTYLISHSETLFNQFSPFLNIFEKRGQKKDRHYQNIGEDHDILLFGYSKIGPNIISSFKKYAKDYLVIDYDPKIINQLIHEKVPCHYADLSNSDSLNDINFQNTKMIISSVKDVDANIVLLKKIRAVNKNCIVITFAHYVEGALKLYEEGASYVIMPHFLGGEHASMLISSFGFDLDKFLQEKTTHLKSLLLKQQLENS